MRRVVLTGLGLVTPLGDGVEATWKALIAGQSGIRAIEGLEGTTLPTTIAGQIPQGIGPGLFDFDAYVTAKDRRRMSDFIIYGLAAAQQAIQTSGLEGLSEEALTRAGVLIGSGVGGMAEISTVATAIEYAEHGAVRRVSPFFITANLINLLSGQISIKYGLKGPNLAVSTACATGAHAIGEAARLIEWGDADIMVAGGAEAPICELGLAGLSRAQVLSTRWNASPERASRPWDKGRDGFVIGEGAGVVVLEELEHAKKRGAPIIAELSGYAQTSDAHHATTPARDGKAVERCMAGAIKRAGLELSDIDYINAHASSTPADVTEALAVQRLFGDDAKTLCMSSTKSATGHLLGAAGAVEAIFSALAIQNNVAPPTLNLDNVDGDIDLDLVPFAAQERPVRAALTNAFGFGGTNVSLVLKSFA